jgi:hypothetical protein
MKRTLLKLWAVATLSLVTQTQAQWQTVDVTTPAAGRAIVADNAGNFISLALDYTTTNAITAVNRSSDGGVTWQTVGFVAGYAVHLTAAPDGALFASGNRSTTVSGRAFVWQSLDHGATWTVSDPWAGQSTTFLCLDVAAGNSGAIYVNGRFSGGNQWVVRKGQRSASGISWTTADSITTPQSGSICVRAGVSGQPDEVFVSGNGSGVVRRSLDGGVTWLTVDTSNLASSGVAAGPNGSVYVAGRLATTTSVTNQTIVKKKVVVTVTTSTEYSWLVRRSTDNGATWTNVDYFPNGWPLYGSISADVFGRVLVAGFNNATTPNTWLVRGSVDGGATWTTTDLFLPTNATLAQAEALAIDASGDICVIGEVRYGDVITAPIRRLPAQ